MRTKNEINVRLPLSSPSYQPWTSPSESEAKAESEPRTLANPYKLTPIKQFEEFHHDEKHGDCDDSISIGHGEPVANFAADGNKQLLNCRSGKKGGMFRFFPKLKNKKSRQSAYTSYCNSSSQEERQLSLSSFQNDNNSIIKKKKSKLKYITKNTKTNNTNINIQQKTKHNLPNKNKKRCSTGLGGPASTTSFSQSEQYFRRTHTNNFSNDTTTSNNTLPIDNNDIHKYSNNSNTLHVNNALTNRRNKYNIAPSQGTYSTVTTTSSATLNSTFSEHDEMYLPNSNLQTWEDDDHDAHLNGLLDENLDFFNSLHQKEEAASAANTAATSIKISTISSLYQGSDPHYQVKKGNIPRGQAVDKLDHRTLPIKEKIANTDNDNKNSNRSDKIDERQRSAQTLVLTRSALSRPFGRTGLPAHLAKQWQVEVSILKFDETNWMWNYIVQVQKEEHGTLSIMNDDVDNNNDIDNITFGTAANGCTSGASVIIGGTHGDEPSLVLPPTLRQLQDANSISINSSIAAANVTRTLEDFVWLEQTMREEYHGALVLPLLSLVVMNGRSSLDWTTTESMNKEDFRKGEWDPLVMSETYLDEYLKDGRKERRRRKMECAGNNGAMEEGEEEEEEEAEADGNVEEEGGVVDTELKCPTKVDPKVLGDWLSDVINCVRGKGELIIKYGRIDVIHSEAMEMFLYSAKPLPKPATRYYKNVALDRAHSPPAVDFCFGTNTQAERGLDFSKTATTTNKTKDPAANFCAFPQFISNQLSCANPTDICEMLSTDQDRPPPLTEIDTTLQSDFILSRRSLVHAKLIPQWDWTSLILLQHNQPIAITTSPSESQKYKKQQQSKVLVLQRLAIANQREYTLRAMYRLRILLDHETLVSGVWKQFAISLSNLYSYEKDIESCKIGDLAKGKKIFSSSSQRKSNKSMVDDALRILARQKMDRAVPSLKVLSVMLSAYFADFSSVDSSLRAFGDALQKVRILGKEEGDCDGDDDCNDNSESWQSHYLRSLSSFLSPSGSSKGDDQGGIIEAMGRCRDYNVGGNKPWFSTEEEAFRKHISSLESVIKSSLLQLCGSTDLRVSRMAWKFFKMEAGQAALLRGAAVKLRSKIGCKTGNSNDKKHKKYDKHNDCDGGRDDKGILPVNCIKKSGEDEKELDLVKKMLDLGLQSKRKEDGITEVEGDTDDDEEDSDSDQMVAAVSLVEKALEFVRERSGRWDADVALVIMEAAGVEDAEVLLEETTRDLRQARKLALGLRENVGRCAEAVDMLKEIAIGSNCQRGVSVETTYITKLRERFMTELSVVFSSKYHRLEDGADAAYQKRIMSKIGINTDDTAGWLQAENNDREGGAGAQTGRCGEAAIWYERVRENETQQLLDSLSDILGNYEHRIESIENFVYMHCVGIQLEKHFSKQRVEALAAWDRKTNIKTAINIATRKRMTDVVEELKGKMTDFEIVSHTSVKEAKERHLSSKVLKGELEALSFRRFELLKEDATAQVEALINLWGCRK